MAKIWLLAKIIDIVSAIVAVVSGPKKRRRQRNKKEHAVKENDTYRASSANGEKSHTDRIIELLKQAQERD